MIDVGQFRIDANGNDKAVKVNYLRSETFLTETMETVCLEMRNYSHFTDDYGITTYHRYQNRIEDKGPLRLKHFGWSVDSQDHLRLACDEVSTQISDDVTAFYMAKRFVPPFTFCVKFLFYLFFS